MKSSREPLLYRQQHAEAWFHWSWDIGNGDWDDYLNRVSGIFEYSFNIHLTMFEPAYFRVLPELYGYSQPSSDVLFLLRPKLISFMREPLQESVPHGSMHPFSLNWVGVQHRSMVVDRGPRVRSYIWAQHDAQDKVISCGIPPTERLYSQTPVSQRYATTWPCLDNQRWKPIRGSDGMYGGVLDNYDCPNRPQTDEDIKVAEDNGQLNICWRWNMVEVETWGRSFHVVRQDSPTK
ncbi:hypothetical protein PROFUN_09472 [Planoprotostelium fungivorum]|uniref:Uncharacterized protein n=1 Tax=Planoprotostelium fungivorum TaxID=1890364 RepID=A0A2P6NH27_9EUKA|nr:hypothetical protein PROFUN_09472 [Planoprotostelium fungivorum]